MTAVKSKVEKPRYTHDCPKCVFMGSFERWDVWICPRPGQPQWDSVIARFGNDAPEYSSFPRTAFVEIVVGSLEGRVSDASTGKLCPPSLSGWILAVLVCAYREEEA